MSELKGIKQIVKALDDYYETMEDGGDSLTEEDLMNAVIKFRKANGLYLRDEDTAEPTT